MFSSPSSYTWRKPLGASLLLCLLITLAACGPKPQALPEPEPQPDPDPKPAQVVAAFTASTTSGTVPLTVDFNANGSSGQDITFHWELGEDSSAEGAELNHTFAVAGDHPVKLTVTDAHGTSDTAETLINVLPRASASFTLDNRSGYAPHAVTFDASGSNGHNLDYLWDLGDGNSATGPVTTHSYAQAGTYTVTLQVTDSTGATDSSRTSVRVAQQADAAFTMDPLLTYTGQPVEFDAATSSGEGLIYTWSLPDGTVLFGQTASHSFNTPGEHAVTLTISDSRGNTLTSSQSVLAVERATAVISASSDVATRNLLPVDFQAHSEYGFSFEWQVDGAPVDGAESLTHVFSGVGLSEVELTVTDALGDTATTGVLVNVAEPVVAIDTGESNSFLITADGALYSWGRVVYGVNGDGGVPDDDLPGRVPFPPGVLIRQVAVGYVHALALDADGNVWAWGDDEGQGKLGLGAQAARQMEPVQVPFPQLQQAQQQPPANVRIVQVAANYYSSFALDDQGNLWVWGRNQAGQLGLGHMQDVHQPTMMHLPDLVSVVAGREHTLAVNTSGELWGWGSNAKRQLALPEHVTQEAEPQLIVPGGVQQAAAGEFFSVALDDQGYLWHWGAVDPAIDYWDNADSRIIDSPLRLDAAGSGFTQVQGFFWHAIALHVDGSVVAWGAGQEGELGDGLRQHSTLPVSVSLPAGSVVSTVAAGLQRSMLLDQYGLAWSFGASALGVGGDPYRSLVPLQVHYPAAP